MENNSTKKVYEKGSIVLCDHCDSPLFVLIKDVEEGCEVDFKILQAIIPQTMPEKNDVPCHCSHCKKLVLFMNIIPYAPYEDIQKEYFDSSDYDNMYKDMPECIYTPVSKNACNPIELMCDGRCQGSGHCIFNPFSEFYNMSMDEFKQVIKDAEEYMKWLADFIETDEGKRMIQEFEQSLLKRENVNEIN
jgi:hypothetical protein